MRYLLTMIFVCVIISYGHTPVKEKDKFQYSILELNIKLDEAINYIDADSSNNELLRNTKK